jgi:hypothetical protein
MTADVAGTYWNYGPKSSGRRTAISTLRQFGLIGDVGNKKSGQFKVSELAMTILLDTRDQSPERDRAIKKAALRPPIYRELLNHWGGKLPADATMGTYLTLQKGFNDQSVASFIEDFRHTIEFAKLSSADIMQPAGEEDGDGSDPENGAADGERNDSHKRQHRRRPMQAGIKEDVFTLDEGDVVLQWPEDMTSESLTDVESWLKLVIGKLKRSVGGTPKAKNPERAAAEDLADNDD